MVEGVRPSSFNPKERSKRLLSLQVLALAMAYQSVTTAHLMRPPINEVEPEIVEECLQYSRCGQAEDYNSSETINATYISESG